MADVKNVNIDKKPLSQPKKRKKKQVERRDRLTPFTIFMLVILSLYVISIVYLLSWAFITSVKYNRDFNSNILGFPRPTSPNGNVVWGWRFSNYIEVFDYFWVRQVIDGQMVQFGFDKMLLYSILYAVGSAFFASLVPMVTAYLCARFDFALSKIMYTIVVVTMILPLIGGMPATIKMIRDLGLYDTIWGMWITAAGWRGLYFLVFYGTFKSLPMAYSEAAKIDGAGNLSILVRIVIPLVKNMFFTVFLLHFISYWNDYNTPLIYMPSYPTIAYGLYVVTTTSQNEMAHTTRRMTASMLMLCPVLALFLMFHNRLLGNLTVGGLKG